MPDAITLNHGQEWANRSIRGWNSGSEWIFSILERGTYIGNIALHMHKRYLEVGYWLDPKYWGMGIMTESLKELLTWANRTIGAKKFFATTGIDNKASQIVLARCGFQEKGTTYLRANDGSSRRSKKFYLEYK